MLYLNSNIIPLDSEKQILTEFDLIFMQNHNLSESEMKKIKSLERLLRYDGVRISNKEAE